MAAPKSLSPPVTRLLLRPLARVERISLFEREVKERLSRAALDVLFAAAGVMSEGQRSARNKREAFFGSTMLTFEQLGVPHHVVSTDLPGQVPPEMRDRAVVCEQLEMFPVECVARGYLTGSGLREYDATGAVCGIALPDGLVDGSRLSEPIFTPATKAELGDHDENVSFEAVVATVGKEDAEALRDLTLDIYRRAEAMARERGIILADTKLEFGRRPDGTIVLADEVLTPDSSRFWPADEWSPGRAQPSFDKDVIRRWLTSPESGWDRTSGEAPPVLPDAVVERTRARYVEAYERLTGESW